MSLNSSALSHETCYSSKGTHVTPQPLLIQRRGELRTNVVVLPSQCERMYRDP